MEGEDAFFGHKVVHDSEDSLLHFSGVLGAKDDHAFFGEVDLNRGAILDSVDRKRTLHFSRVEDVEVDFVGVREITLQLVLSRTDQHVVHEQGVVRSSTQNSHLDAVLGVPTGISVHHVESASGVEVVHDDLFTELVAFGGDGDVNITPPDVSLGVVIADDSLVGGRSASSETRIGDESSSAGESGGSGIRVSGGQALNSDLVELRDGEVDHEVAVVKTESVQTQLLVQISCEATSKES